MYVTIPILPMNLEPDNHWWADRVASLPQRSLSATSHDYCEPEAIFARHLNPQGVKDSSVIKTTI